MPKIVLPIVVVVLGVLGAVVLVRSKAPVPRQEPEVVLPLVRVVRVEPRRMRLDVTATGTVLPRTASSLAAQVAGQVISTSPAFVAGGFFARGEVLVSLDRRDYELAVERTRARVAQAELRLVEQQAEAQVASDEWSQLGEGEPDPLVLREPQLAEARAALAAAEAELGQARLDLERSVIRAPFDGRLRRKLVDVGQYLSPGEKVAEIHGVDFAEVRLPVADHQLAFLDVVLRYRDGTEAFAGPTALLTGRFAGQRHTWRGVIVRTEGEVDARSRMLHLVARVTDPYGRGALDGRPPLAVGVFVQASIAGRWMERATLLPRAALRGDTQVLVVDDDDRLRYREVEVVRTQRDLAVIGEGLAIGERVCVSPLDMVVDGMAVRAVEEEVELPEGVIVAEPADPQDTFEPAPSEELATEDVTAVLDVAEAAPAESYEVASFAETGRLLEARLRHDTGGTVLELAVTGELELATSRLTDPERFVIDLTGIVKEGARETLAVAGDPVEQVRVSQFQLDPVPVTRVVFDLSRAVTPVIDQGPGGLTVTFQDEAIQ